MVVIDTPDPRGLAAFYATLLDWELDPEDTADDWVTIRGEGGAPIAFQLVPDLPPATWPEGPVPQQSHLDLYVDAYDEPQSRALALGATVLYASDANTSYRTYADPSGHPFCLCLQPS